MAPIVHPTAIPYLHTVECAKGLLAPRDDHFEFFTRISRVILFLEKKEQKIMKGNNKSEHCSRMYSSLFLCTTNMNSHTDVYRNWINSSISKTRRFLI